MTLCSIGMVAGALVVALVLKRMLLGRRMARLGACGPLGLRAGGEGCHARRGGGWGGRPGLRGPGASRWLRWIFARIDTTPGQEREIRSAIEDAQRTAAEAGAGLSGSRAAVARALAGDAFDEAAFAEASAKLEAGAAAASAGALAALRRVHAVLDPKQRQRLAALVETGSFSWGGPRWGGPYRA